MGELWRAAHASGLRGGAHAGCALKTQRGRRWEARVGGGGKAGWEAVGGTLRGPRLRTEPSTPHERHCASAQVRGVFLHERRVGVSAKAQIRL